MLNSEDLWNYCQHYLFYKINVQKDLNNRLFGKPLSTLSLHDTENIGCIYTLISRNTEEHCNCKDNYIKQLIIRSAFILILRVRKDTKL